jgi:hypothetical protein
MSSGHVEKRFKIANEGDRYGRFIVRGESQKDAQSHRYVVCDCDCGTKRYRVRVAHLASGASTSCGCARFGAVQRKRATMQAAEACHA